MEHKKIDILVKHREGGNWVYECSTTSSKTLKEAKERFLSLTFGFKAEWVKAEFSK